MSAKELRQKSIKDLTAELKTSQSQLAELYLKRATTDFKKHHQFRNHRRRIAQLKTILREQQLVSEEAKNG